MMESRDREIKSLLDAAESDDLRRSRLKEVINGIIDFREMGKTALGDHWTNISEQERDSFVTVFSQIVRDQSISNLDIYRASITYDGISVEGSTAVVRTSTVYKDVPARVEYHLHKSARNENRWMAHDFLLDDVSTAQGYARSFQSVVRKRGFDALMSSLRKKQSQIAK
ncbi:MAG: ABC transporter substrate-binding protein [Rhodothermales bacterium]|nr:ABC transporter substrate-binding protein [Rhodothermales bacterium]